MPRTPAFVLAVSLLIVCPSFAHAQSVAAATPLSSDQLTLACAPPAALAEGRRPTLRVAGAQDTVARSVFDDHDVLIVTGGMSTGLRVGQQYFVRRPVSAPNYANRFGVRHPILTAGWVRIVATNDGSSIAIVEHACSAINTGDYLDPFVVPAPPATTPPTSGSGDLDFEMMGRVMFGQEERSVVSPSEFLFIDRGAGQGVDFGARFAIYRDVQEFVPEKGRMRSARLPLAAIGEGIVVASGPSVAVVQLMTARDAVKPGDFVVPRRR